jgi:4-amino-4-deoxy-L-arabinose transferase-like glycosyltransferase
MKKKYKILVIVISIIYVIYHLVTLSYSPLPWFDEISFAGITNSYIKAHTFYQEAISIDTPGQNSMYGPMFFALQAFIIKLLGWSTFNFRLSNLLFGFINLFMVYKICRYLKFKPHAILITIGILAFERSYNQFLHSGRMDFMTIFFFFASYLVFVQIPAKMGAKWVAYTIGSAVLVSIALLTTPRIIFGFSFFFFYFFYELYENRKEGASIILLKYGLMLLTICSLFYAWVYIEFGSLHNFVFVNYTSNEKVRRHVGMGHEGMKFNSGVLYFAYALICVVLLFIKKQAWANARLLLFTVPVIASFLVLVGGGISGRYYAMIAPFTTILIVGVTMSLFENAIFKIVNYGILGILIVGFVFKGFYVFATWQERDHVVYEQRIMQYIPERSTVAGDFEYYYFARRKNCFFQSLKENGMPNTVLNYYMTHNYDYFIFNKNNQELDNYQIWVLKNRYKLIAKVDDKPKAAWLTSMINKLGYRITESYACYIYQYTGNSGPSAAENTH